MSRNSKASRTAWIAAFSFAVTGTLYGQRPSEPRINPIQTVQFDEPLPGLDVPSPADEEALAPAVVPNRGSGLPPELGMDGGSIVTPTPMDTDGYAESGLPYDEGQTFESPIPHSVDQPYEVAPPIHHDMGSEIWDDQSIAVDGACWDQTPVYNSGSWHRSGRWYAEQELIVWTKADQKSQILATRDVNVPALDLTTTTESFDFEPGARLTIGHNLGRDAAGRDHAWEANFLGLLDWQARAKVTNEASLASTFLGVSNLNFGSAIPGFVLNTRQEYVYDSDINSVSLNYRIRTRPSRDSLALQPNGVWVRHATSGQIRSLSGGLRTMQLNETFLYSAYRGISETGRYAVNTENDMYGVQVGGELYEKGNDFQFGVRGNLAAMMNFANRRSNLSFDDTDLAGEDFVNRRSEKLSEEHLAAMVEGTLFAAYEIRPNVSLRLSYDILFLTGVAIASENIGLDESFPVMTTTGVAVYHGASTGIVATW
ncbi:MAG: hypothetical protein KDA60_03310 [Planctomycetales bacterium]|nr:hypothetical protein [Planctomycetales bacterium]